MSALVILLVVASRVASAVGGDSHPLDRMATAKAECLRKRVIASSAGSSSANCVQSRPDPERDGLMLKMRNAFCEDASAFCDKFRGFSDKEWMSDFVNARCEPSGSMLSPMRLGNLSDGDVRDDSHFAQLMMTQWGCDLSQERMVPAANGKDPALFAQYRCDSAKMPYVCGGPDALPTTGKESSAALRMYGATLEPIPATSGQKCWISMGRALPSSLPAPASGGESIESYRARIRGNSSAESRLTGIENEVGKRAIGLFARTQELLSKDPDRFIETARALLTPEVVRNAKEDFEISKRAVLAALRNMNPPAPAVILQEVEESKLVDLDQLTATPPNRDAWASLEHSCISGDATPSYGVDNAVFLDGNGGLGAESHGGTVVICPETLAMSKLTDSRGLVRIITHELGHALDNASLGIELARRAELRGGCAPLPASEDETGAEAFGFWRRTKNYASCLHERSLQVSRADRPRKCADVFAAASAAMPSSEFWRCMSSQYHAPPAGSGLLSFANCTDTIAQRALVELHMAQIHGQKSDPALEERLTQAIAGLEGTSKDQTAESTAEHIAAIALPYAFRDPAYGPPSMSELTELDQSAEVLVSLGDTCFEKSDPKDSHPHRDFRISLFAQSPGIRAVVHCPKPIARPACSISGEL